MKQLSQLILFSLQLSFSAFGAEEPTAHQAGKTALSITAFTLKSTVSEGEMKMDEKGRIHENGKHVATANSNGEFRTPEGKLIMRIKDNGELEPEVLGLPAKVTLDGTLTAGGKSHSWVEGKFQVGGQRHLEITPKDYPSKQAATLLFIIASSRREAPQL